ncbi:hypothetical protein BDN72DRAFT_811453 [Pluteus cervinus]|uniref:Uncharacterized protein n=1 Tax=Pluteus cervinus TaxID=181527 RepID=A0ACD3BC63_9AGAR|nr:hypothetical protein BDN72DRAFT_811453 [Pluteus cervinus]
MNDIDLFGENEVVYDSEGEGDHFGAGSGGPGKVPDNALRNEEPLTNGFGDSYIAQDKPAAHISEAYAEGGASEILSIADRAKTRTRGAKQSQLAASSSSSSSPQTGRTRKAPGPVIDVIELTSDEDEFVRPKPKKAKSTTKPKTKPLPPPEVPEDGPKTPPKPRPRPRPRMKTKETRPASPPPFPDSTLPHPTSPSRFSEAFLYAPSELPPSDPPTSTPHIFDHPPIAVLPGIESEPPTSSFSSIYSPAKRNGANGRHVLPDPVTGIVPDDNFDDSLLLDRPPPTFFAGSSSPPVPATAPPPPQPEIVPPTAESSKAGAKKQSKPRKPRKKKVVDEEQGDDAPPPTKGRTKRKPRSKVEVVMPPAPERARSPLLQDDDYTPPTGGGQVAPHSAIPQRRDSVSSLSPVPDSEDEPEFGSSGQKRKAQDTNEIQESPKKKVKKAKEKVKVATKPAQSKGKGKARQIITSDNDEDQDELDMITPRPGSKPVEETFGSKHNTPKSKRIAKKPGNGTKTLEPLAPPEFDSPEEEIAIAKENFEPLAAPKSPPRSTRMQQAPPSRSSISSQYTIAPKTKSTPMSELIKRANSLPGSPFPATPSPSIKRPPSFGLAYSPYLKSSRSMLSRIAPLHPNRRTPPPPLPPPPPRKKTKKELEREEKWEEELVDSVGGIEAWACMTDPERSDLRKAKWAMEMGGWDD